MGNQEISNGRRGYNEAFLQGSSRIPEEVRNRLGLKPGVQFVVLGDKDVVILKVIQPPQMSEFSEIVGRARRAAKQAGMKRADITKAKRKARKMR